MRYTWIFYVKFVSTSSDSYYCSALHDNTARKPNIRIRPSRHTDLILGHPDVLHLRVVDEVDELAVPQLAVRQRHVICKYTQLSCMRLHGQSQYQASQVLPRDTRVLNECIADTKKKQASLNEHSI